LYGVDHSGSPDPFFKVRNNLYAIWTLDWQDHPPSLPESATRKRTTLQVYWIDLKPKPEGDAFGGFRTDVPASHPFLGGLL